MAPGLRSLLVAGAVAATACTAASEEVRPPPSGIAFPTGVAIAPTEDFLFVTTGNSDLRFDSGSLLVLDLAAVDAVVDGWTAGATVPPGCRQDTDRRETLICNEDPDSEDELPAPPFILADRGVRVGNFSSGIAVQQRDGAQLRLLVGVRGDPSITYADWDGQRLQCGGDEGFPLCDEGHHLTAIDNDPEIATIEDEPFNIYVNSREQFAVVTHLTSGTATLVDSPANGTPFLSDVVSGLFNANAGGAIGAAGVAGRSPAGPDADIVYVSGRTEDRVQMMTVARDGLGAFFVLSNFFFIDIAGANTGGSIETRAMTFTRNGDRMLLVNRAPPSLQMYDTSLDDTGFPRNAPLAAIDLCRGASNMAVADVGDGERAYVTCFHEVFVGGERYGDEVYVLRTEPTLEVESIITVGSGPFGVVASPTRQKLYVTNFLDDTIAVVELAPDSPRRYQVLLRIGEPRR